MVVVRRVGVDNNKAAGAAGALFTEDADASVDEKVGVADGLGSNQMGR